MHLIHSRNYVELDEEELDEEELDEEELDEEEPEGVKRYESSIGPSLLSSLIALCSSHSGRTPSNHILSINSVPSNEVGFKQQYRPVFS